MGAIESRALFGLGASLIFSMQASVSIPTGRDIRPPNRWFVTGLVTIDKESSVVRLVHYTTQDYFVRSQSTWFPTAQLFLTTICTTYLSYQSFADGYAKMDELFDQRLKSQPFYDYAASNWGHHSRGVSNCHNVLSFLRKPAQV
ncbi:hypothetical protein HD806DRAFT_106967 [Xylariaceae sp. AK1471]|nr:hypothetical protein HD806DRAFT_106967 [Xylariaceae sp. AK1471]